MWPLRKLLVVNAILGAVGGVVSALIYFLGHLGALNASTVVFVFIGAPLFQALLLCLYTLFGYPAIKWLAIKGKLDLGSLT